MKTSAFVAALMSALTTVSAYAGRETGNGGDPLELEFKRSAQEAIQDVKADPEKYPRLKDVDLMKTILGTDVHVVDQPLFVKKGEVSKESTAMNYNGPDTILINRQRWSEIVDAKIRRALALHEVLGLLKIEGTGDYSISQVYLKNLGVSCEEDLCVDVRKKKAYKAIMFKAWPVAHHGPIVPKSCERGWLLDLKEQAQASALEDCREDGARDCRPDGVSLIANGNLDNKEAYQAMGKKWPPVLGMSPATYGCIVRASASGRK